MKEAFTLIELLVVVLIIGILSAVALPQYQRAVEKARLTEAMTFAENFAKAQQMYHMSNDTFAPPEDGAVNSNLDITLPSELKHYTVSSVNVGTNGQGVGIYLTPKASSISYKLNVEVVFQNGKYKVLRLCNNTKQGCTAVFGHFPDCTVGYDEGWCYGV